MTGKPLGRSLTAEQRPTGPGLRLVRVCLERGELHTWPRPPIPEFSSMVAVLGEEIYTMLGGSTSVATALSTAQARVDALMRENQRY